MFKIFKYIFSVKNEYIKAKKYKIIYILGLKIKYSCKPSLNEIKDLLKGLIDIEAAKLPKINILTIEETMDILLSTNKSIVRYGDGELSLCLCSNSLGFQKYDNSLAKKLIDVLGSDDENLLIGLNSFYSQPIPHNKHWEIIKRCQLGLLHTVLDTRKTYVDANISRVASIESVKKWKELFKNKEIVIIEGELSRVGVGNDLFETAKSIERILCPAINSYDKYSDILEECKKINKNKLLLLALGPTAKILGYDLFKLGYRVIDIGHLDVCYEWIKIGSRKVSLPYKYVNEAPCGNIVSECNDKDYNSQIIARI